MATVSRLQPLSSSTQSGRSSERRVLYPASQTAAVYAFHPSEEEMLPADWAEPGNPTPYELRVTLHTCKRLWQMNRDALEHPDCDRERTLENIKVLEKLYLILMDYLVE